VLKWHVGNFYCINCDKVFEKKNKGFKRKSIDANLPNSYRSILETLEEPVTPGKKVSRLKVDDSMVMVLVLSGPELFVS
jgi:hypothetical protein